MVELAVCSRFLKFSMKPWEKTSGRVSTCTAAIPAVFQSRACGLLTCTAPRVAIQLGAGHSMVEAKGKWDYRLLYICFLN